VFDILFAFWYDFFEMECPKENLISKMNRLAIQKHVRFATNENLVTIYELPPETEEELQDRRERIYAEYDRIRNIHYFRKVGALLTPILHPQHREKIFTKLNNTR